ncbi:MAG: amidohydrolase [Bacteroidales bacterium]|nr:amidohydrolase [Bacteroidales bacterium]
MRDLASAIALRHDLHAHAQLSGMELYAHDCILKWLAPLCPTKVFSHVGGHSVVAVWGMEPSLPTILFRADTDALPIEESADFSYCSRTPGVSHKCGHDGHSAALLAFAHELFATDHPSWLDFTRCNIVLVFQGEEETGQGSRKLLEEQVLQVYNIQVCYAVHNVPGYPMGQIVCAEPTFAAASCGIGVALRGRTTHASTPELGKNPAAAMAQLTMELMRWNDSAQGIDAFRLITPVFLHMGERAFGTSPGDASVGYTLRTYSNRSMETLFGAAQQTVQRIATEQGLLYEITQAEAFRATEVSPTWLQRLRRVCGAEGWDVCMREKPFRWSEDFANYLQLYPGVMVGVGAGATHVELHHPDYDFPDELLMVIVNLYVGLLRDFCSTL